MYLLDSGNKGWGKMEYLNPKEIYNAYMKEDISASEAAKYMDETVGGIKGIEFKKDFKFTVVNTIQKYSLPYSKGLSKKEKKKVLSLLGELNVYTKGRSEIHLGKGMSSKHYRGGLDRVIASAG